MSLANAPATSATNDVTFTDTVTSSLISIMTSARPENSVFTDVSFSETSEPASTYDVTSAGASFHTVAASISHFNDITFNNWSSLSFDNNTDYNNNNNTTNGTYVDLEELNIAMTLSLIPTITYVGLLIVMGLVGNSLVFAVYYRRFKPSATRSYVLTMSVVDLASNVLALPSEILDIRFIYTNNIPWLCRVGRFTNSFLSVVSAFLLVAVAKDRYNKICHPLEKARSGRRILAYIGACCLGSLALSVPFAVLNGAHTIKTPVENVTGVTCSVDDAFVGTLFPTIYSGVMGLIFIVCVAVMCVSYVKIARVLWRHKNKLSQAPPAVSGGVVGSDASGKKGRRLPDGSVDRDTSSGPLSFPVVVDQDSSSGPRGSAHVDQDSSSGPRTVSTDKPSSSVEVVVAFAHQPEAFSDKSVLPMSIHNFNYDGPDDLCKDSNGATASAPSDMEMTALSSLLLHAEQPATDSKIGSSFDNVNDGVAGTTENPEILEESRIRKGEGGGGGEETNSEGKATTSLNASAANETKPKTDSSADLSPAENSTTTATTTTTTPSTATVDFPPPLSEQQRLGYNSSDRSANEKRPSLLQAVLKAGRRQHYSVRRKPARQRGSVKKIPSSTTFMMFVLTAMFVINYLPHLVIISIRPAVEGDLSDGLTGWLLNVYNIALRSYFLNCAVNSVVYGFCNARFRNECRNLICSRARR